MLREEKNLKDSNLSLAHLPLTNMDELGGGLSYTKTDKLITALYMVTDIIDKDEPLRNKLRTLGTEVISDINSLPTQANILCGKISEIMSFLDIASAVNIISQMNYNILRKEFIELDQSIKESFGKVGILSRQINLTEFFKEEVKDSVFSIGHHSTRIGVQKGSTLMKALSDKINPEAKLNMPGLASRADFDMLKKQRRYEITSFITKNGGNATITDIKNGAQGSIVSCGEKTLQRELMSMVKDGVLNKTGQKRWSRYILVAPN